MENISFDEAQVFVQKLNQMTGQRFSLPTEAQWEYAARGGNKSNGGKFANGKPFPGDVWYHDNDEKPEVPMPVSRAKVTNELGISHMSGNVEEWCLDWYSDVYYNQSPSKNPCNTEEKEYRVCRGGSFKDDQSKAVSVFVRSANEPFFKDETLGLRLVLNK